MQSRSKNTRDRHLPGFDREPRGPGQRPGIEPDVRSSCPLCPSPTVARMRLSRGGVKGDPQVERSGP
jgi:hypothetical protein